MKKFALLLPAITLILVGAGCSSGYSSTPSAPPVSRPSAVAPSTPPSAAATSAPAQAPSPAPQPTPSAMLNTVTYTDAGFSPAVLTVKVGTTVTFSNTASDAMRVASNPHPIHNGYSMKGGCVGSTFDSCKDIGPGTSWTFKFDIAGKWGFHNHLNPSEGGTIVVQK